MLGLGVIIFDPYLSMKLLEKGLGDPLLSFSLLLFTTFY